MVIHKTCYEVISETGHYTCELTGNMLYGRSISEYPCTGDWVIFQSINTDKGINYKTVRINREKIIVLFLAVSLLKEFKSTAHTD